MRIDGPEDAVATLLLAHGAGAGMDHEFMQAIAEPLGKRGIRVLRFEFPYMQKRRQDGKKRPPDRADKLLAAFRERLEAPEIRGRLFIGGKSMGGRIASLLATEPELPRPISGLICLGFPLHPPGKPDNGRADHLQSIDTDTLILQGERDSFGTREELEAYPLSNRVQVQILPDGDHSFKPRKRSGWTQEQHLQRALDAIEAFIRETRA